MLSFYLSALESAADKEDFRALYRRYHGVMERTALAILQDPRDAEENRGNRDVNNKEPGHSAGPARCGGGRAGGFYPGD